MKKWRAYSGQMLRTHNDRMNRLAEEAGESPTHPVSACDQGQRGGAKRQKLQ
jgi:hypothetical protein